jgi:hypothetical protein
MRQLTPADPINLDGPGVIRWAAGDPNGRRSLTWVVKGARNDDSVYIGTRSTMHDMKLSLHPKHWRMAFNKDAAASQVFDGIGLAHP